VKGDPAIFEHVRVMGHLQRAMGVLLDDENHDAHTANGIHGIAHIT
jgi:hypothetical protein